MKKTLPALLAILLGFLLVSPANAASGLYLGAGVGQTTVKDDTGAGTFDAKDPAYKGFLGYRFNLIPIIDLAAEVAYTEFGKPKQTVAGQDLQYKLHGASAAGLVIFPLGPLDFYGKGGMLSWKSEFSAPGATTTSTSGTDPFYGAGIGFQLWKVGIRAEYERFKIKDVDRVEMLSVSVLFQF
jgi:opacity protein-like surface antigen